MSETIRSSVVAEALPNRFQKLLSALRTVKVKEDCDSSGAPDGGSLQTPDANNNGECLSAPFDWSCSKSTSEPSPTPNNSLEETPSDSCSASEAGRQGCSAPFDEIIWDHTMSASDEEDSDSDRDFQCIDEALNCKWYSGGPSAHTFQDESSKQTVQANYAARECFVDAENSYEVDEVAIKLKELANSDMNSYGPGKVMYAWSCDISTDEDRNKIYDKWMCDLESWERQRLLWLDERGKIEGFDSSYEDRTFLIRVDNRKPETTGSKSSSMKTHDSTEKTDLVQLGECSNTESNLIQISEAGSECEHEPLNLPHVLTSVYEFTDRHLWRKYHKCFKEGKYTNK